MPTFEKIGPEGKPQQNGLDGYFKWLRAMRDWQVGFSAWVTSDRTDDLCAFSWPIRFSP